MAKAVTLRIRLDGISPPIWRRIVVPGSIPLDGLHALIQAAMGWTDSHLHMFVFGRRRYTLPVDPEEDDGSLDERRYSLEQLAARKGDKFAYTYDFGDDWHHTLTVQKVEEVDGAVEAACTGGARACPPEDCGGPYGYLDLLDAVSDPKHPMHAEMSDWAGEIDAEAFDVAMANASVQAAATPPRRNRKSGR
jgi:hypothetical protein